MVNKERKNEEKKETHLQRVRGSVKFCFTGTHIYGITTQFYLIGFIVLSCVVREYKKLLK